MTFSSQRADRNFRCGRGVAVGVERREYRRPVGDTVLWAMAMATALGLGVATVLNPGQGGAITMVYGAFVIVLGVFFGLTLIRGRVLIVSDAGLRGARWAWRMDIPWSSVRTFETTSLSGQRMRGSLVTVCLVNGRHFFLPCTGGTPESATMITNELLAAQREHGK